MFMFHQRRSTHSASHLWGWVTIVISHSVRDWTLLWTLVFTPGCLKIDSSPVRFICYFYLQLLSTCRTCFGLDFSHGVKPRVQYSVLTKIENENRLKMKILQNFDGMSMKRNVFKIFEESI